MDINTIAQFITSYGFPIVWTFVLGWFIVTKLDANTQSNADLAELIKELILKLHKDGDGE